jgi:small subunit ribosomal protein S11
MTELKLGINKKAIKIKRISQKKQTISKIHLKKNIQPYDTKKKFMTKCEGVKNPMKNKFIFLRKTLTKKSLLACEVSGENLMNLQVPFKKILEEKLMRIKLDIKNGFSRKEEWIKKVSKRLLNTSTKKQEQLTREITQNEWTGIVYIQCTNNNSILTLTDKAGNCKTWASAGVCDFKGSRRSTTFAAQETAKKVAKKALLLGYRRVCVKLKGPVSFSSKKKILKSLARHGLIIKRLEHLNLLAHNGCRLPKKRRV